MKQTKLDTADDNALFVADDVALKQFVGYHLKRATNVIMSDLATTLAPHELRMLTYTALVLIVDNPGIRQFQLADAMDIERPNLVIIIDELEQRELILREKVPTDRRAYAMHPTLAGKQLYKKATNAVNAHDKKMFKHVSKTDQKLLISTLQKLIDQY